MAKMNEIFMVSVASGTLEIFGKTILTKADFCKELGIPSNYLSFLQDKKKWHYVPAWVWYLFADVVNKIVEFDGKGKLVNVSYSLEEIHEECKEKAVAMLEAKESVSGDILEWPESIKHLTAPITEQNPEYTDVDTLVNALSRLVNIMEDNAHKTIDMVKELKDMLKQWEKQ